MDWAPTTGQLDERADGLWEKQIVEGYPDEEAVQRMGLGMGGCSDAPLHVLSVHFIQQWCCISGNRHGRALDHGAGRWPWSHPLRFLPPLCLFLLQPLLRHLAPVHCRGVAATGPAGREERGGGGLVNDSVGRKI